jgi:ABC-type uncharacterized transport system auxiliary subunit
MLRARGTLWVGVAVLIAAGCGFTAPPIRYFEIRPEAVGTQPGPKLPSIMVPDFACLSAYDQLRVVLRKSPVEVMTSRNLQWTTVPGRMLAEGLRSRLSEIGRFEMVRREASPRPPYTVEGLVQLIELSEKPKLTARLALQVDVRRTADGEIISEESVDESQPAKGDSPTDGILALQELYSHILDDLSRRIIAAIEKDIQGAKADARPYGIGSKPASRGLSFPQSLSTASGEPTYNGVRQGAASHGSAPIARIVFPLCSMILPHPSCAKKSFPLSSTRMKAGKSTTSIL